MNIKMNHYLNQISYMTAMDERASKPDGDRRIGSGKKSGTNKDTVLISVEGQLFTAKQKTSDSEMGLIEITSDFDSFTRAVKSMNEPLPVDWTAIVDPYQTFTNLAKIESRLKQLADPTVSRNDEEIERIADEYAPSIISLYML